MSLKITQLGTDIEKSNLIILELQNEILTPVEEITIPQTDSVEEFEDLKNQITVNYEEEKIKTDVNSRNIGSQNGSITSCKVQEPLLKKDLDQKEKVYSDKKGALEHETNLTFDSLLLTGEITDAQIQHLKLEYENLKEAYRHEYSNVVESFSETKHNKNPELRANDYHFDTLVRILCGRFKLDDLTPELIRLNEELANFGKLQLEIIFNVFSKVEKSYGKLKTLVVYLNNFFKANKISNDYIFRVDFLDKNDISIDWIDKMRKSAKVQAYGKDLFSDLEENETLSPEQLIINIAQKFSKIKNCELSDLLNPKYYFELKVGMYDENNDSNSGSGGQAYTALALLCIGRLSVIQKETRPGIKFIIIESYQILMILILIPSLKSPDSLVISY